MEKVNINKKLGLIDEYWQPKIVGELNGQCVKLVKLKGEFIWHHHEAEEELFLVIKGPLTIKLRNRASSTNRLLKKKRMCFFLNRYPP